VLANRAFRHKTSAIPDSVQIRLALEQSDGTVSHFQTQIFPDTHPLAAGISFISSA